MMGVVYLFMGSCAASVWNVQLWSNSLNGSLGWEGIKIKQSLVGNYIPAKKKKKKNNIKKTNCTELKFPNFRKNYVSDKSSYSYRSKYVHR